VGLGFAGDGVRVPWSESRNSDAELLAESEAFGGAHEMRLGEHPPLIPPSPRRGEGEVQHRGEQPKSTYKPERGRSPMLRVLLTSPPFAAVRAGRSGRRRRAGTRMSPPFRQGRMPCRKARPALNAPGGGKATVGRRAGCPSSWLLLLGQARRSNSLSGRRAKPLAHRARHVCGIAITEAMSPLEKAKPETSPHAGLVARPNPRRPPGQPRRSRPPPWHTPCFLKFHIPSTANNAIPVNQGPPHP
jgi:hypothetical protein